MVTPMHSRTPMRHGALDLIELRARTGETVFSRIYIVFASSLMGALPQDVLDAIINMTDTRTKILLYDSNVLHDLVSITMHKNIEQDIFAAFEVQHNKLLQSCLNCLQYHVWSDGTPMKNRSRHCYKIVKGRTHIRAE